MEIINVISKRFSPYEFNDKPILKQDLNTLFEAAGKAASAFNEQPWRFVYALKSDEKNFNTIWECLVEGNQKWTKDVAVLLITVVKKEFTQNGKANVTAMHDLGLAVGNLSAQATAMGIHLHQMSGILHEKAISNLNIPEGYEPVTAIAIGYYDGEFVEKPRKAITEITFEGKWK
ncbi:MAG: nitroreductase [Flavobacteriales bacterium CG18_big_fil_WC_8_21_14_2_50_32_9]|nr:MAG: nitroreductase [Flavobacteriales bacterium CG18_big_fil_WC_8_21_14_2_50_32_9]PIZ05934.1 MAG: nitroreductase [Flavobacteriales bacterium CG_4_10_14_0_8_um_filter_32_5]PJC61716.1 MAG: nitroreductase [Flavobacteriales bacterium CG_4_9_14_0_2_um_filter_32_27]